MCNTWDFHCWTKIMALSCKVDYIACYGVCSQWLCSLVWRINCLFQTINRDFLSYILVPNYTKWSVSPGQSLVRCFFFFPNMWRAAVRVIWKQVVKQKKICKLKCNVIYIFNHFCESKSLHHFLLGAWIQIFVVIIHSVQQAECHNYQVIYSVKL